MTKTAKREITLDEYDSLRDIFGAEKALLSEYAEAISAASRKEVRTELVAAFSAAAEDVFFLSDLLAARADKKKIRLALRAEPGTT